MESFLFHILSYFALYILLFSYVDLKKVRNRESPVNEVSKLCYNAGVPLVPFHLIL